MFLVLLATNIVFNVDYAAVLQRATDVLALQVLNILYYKRIFKHCCGTQLDVAVLLDVVGEQGKDHSPSLGLIYRKTLYLKEVKVSVDVNLAFLISNDRSGWQDLAHSFIVVKER